MGRHMRTKIIFTRKCYHKLYIIKERGLWWDYNKRVIGPWDLLGWTPFVPASLDILPNKKKYGHLNLKPIRLHTCIQFTDIQNMFMHIFTRGSAKAIKLPIQVRSAIKSTWEEKIFTKTIFTPRIEKIKGRAWYTIGLPSRVYAFLWMGQDMSIIKVHKKK